MKSTSSKQFKQFKQSFNKYVKKFGLDDWTIYFDHEDKDKDSYARTYIDLSGKVATINFQKKLEDTCYRELNIDQTAKHEAIHCLLGELSELAYKRFIDKNHLYQAEESIVIKLEKLL